MAKSNWKNDLEDSYADFGDFKIYDKDLAKFVKKRLRFFDRFNLAKVVQSTQIAFTLMANHAENDPKNYLPYWRGAK